MFTAPHLEPDTLRENKYCLNKDQIHFGAAGKQNLPLPKVSLWHENYSIFKKQDSGETFDLPPNCLKQFKMGRAITIDNHSVI